MRLAQYADDSPLPTSTSCSACNVHVLIRSAGTSDDDDVLQSVQVQSTHRVFACNKQIPAFFCLLLFFVSLVMKVRFANSCCTGYLSMLFDHAIRAVGLQRIEQGLRFWLATKVLQRSHGILGVDATILGQHQQHLAVGFLAQSLDDEECARHQFADGCRVDGCHVVADGVWDRDGAYLMRTRDGILWTIIRVGALDDVGAFLRRQSQHARQLAFQRSPDCGASGNYLRPTKGLSRDASRDDGGRPFMRS
mmetsp:Transcript_1968/g.4847  ORF Transcript_1968/g.4847 Transcript_1968/m.4847 type:complete len:250 (-) Transcript_1968:1247-1996(-)